MTSLQILKNFKATCKTKADEKLLIQAIADVLCKNRKIKRLEETTKKLKDENKQLKILLSGTLTTIKLTLKNYNMGIYSVLPPDLVKKVEEVIKIKLDEG